MCRLIYSGISISCYHCLRRTKAYIVCQHGMIRLVYLKFKNLPRPSSGKKIHLYFVPLPCPSNERYIFIPSRVLNTSKLNAVKCNLTKLTTKSSWYFRSAVIVWYCRLSGLRHCTSVFQRGVPWNVFGRRIEQLPTHLWSIRRRLFLPPHPPLPVSTVNSVFLEDYAGAHGWVAGIVSHGSVVLSSTGWSQWRPLDIPGTHLPYSTMQLLINNWFML